MDKIINIERNIIVKKFETDRKRHYPMFRYSLDLLPEDYVNNQEAFNLLESVHSIENEYYNADEDTTMYDVIYNWVVGLRKLYDESQGKVLAKISEVYALREFNRKMEEWNPHIRKLFIDSYFEKGWDFNLSQGFLIIIDRSSSYDDKHGHEFYLGEGNHRIIALYHLLKSGLITDHYVPVHFSFRGNLGLLKRSSHG